MSESISTFFRWRRDTRYASVVAIWRATSRAASWTERVTLRAGMGCASLPVDAALAVLLTGAISDRAILIDAGPRLAEVAIGPAQPIAAWAEVTVVLRIVDEVGALEAAIVAGGLVEHRDVPLDTFFVDRPSQVRRGAIGGVRNEPLGPDVEALLRSLDHSALSGHFGLPHRGRRLDIDGHRVIEVDQIVGAVGIKGRLARRRVPA